MGGHIVGLLELVEEGRKDMQNNPRQRERRRWLMMGRLIVLAATASLALATPSTKPAENTPRQTAQILSSQGMAALAARDARASLDAFLDAQQLIKTDKSIPPVDPVRVQASHGLAVAYMLSGKYDKAGEIFKAGDTLDKVASTPAVPRVLLYNRAVLDIKQRVNLMRSIKSVKEYLAAHPENDQEMIDLLGTMLDRAARDERFSKASLFSQASAFYVTAAEKLEAANPDQRRWGVEWVSHKEYATRSKERGKIVAEYDKAAGKLNAALADARSANDYFNSERSKAAMGRGNSLREATRQKQSADSRVAECQALADEKRALIPGYPWLTELVPLVPDESSLPKTVAVATEKPAPMDDGTRPDRPRKIRDVGHETSTPPDDHHPPVDGNPPAVNDPPVNPVPEKPRVAEKPQQVRITRYAAAFPVGFDLLITSGAAVDHAESIGLEDSQGNTHKAELVRADEKTGLALIRVAGQKFAYLNLASTFAGGEVRCVGFPTVAIFSPTPEIMPGKANKPVAGNWSAAFSVNPRLAGAPMILPDGSVVGVVMADRDLPPSQTPAIRLDEVKTFLGDDAPHRANQIKTDPPYVLILTASVLK